MTAESPSIKDEPMATVALARSGEGVVVSFRGAWTVRNAAAAEPGVATLEIPAGTREAVVDLSAVEGFDTAGAWLVHRAMRQFESRHIPVSLRGADEGMRGLIQVIAAADKPVPPEKPHERGWRAAIAFVGARVGSFLSQLHLAVSFGGLVLETLFRDLVDIKRLRFTSLVYHMEQAGLRAIPIVSLMSFLVGSVLAYQGAEQLAKFGAETFTVDLVAVSFLREVGILLTAIMVAGRSGSAFTAQIGSMKMREEIDAIRTLGLDPIELLVLPRTLALVVTLPLLGFVGAMAGLFGGGLVCLLTLDMSPDSFVSLLRNSVDAWDFWTAMIKAPVFAFLIAVIGCFEGMRVEGTAESVGQRTTQSVVESIFTVIIADAFFSIVFVELGI